ncbi:MAG TPA: MFS transporter [Candidatus Janibacter merdipullorum]|nr:MFS transporter [Candidatus Janibacter merdipullorum]
MSDGQQLSLRAAHRVLLLLTMTRWLPIGFIVGLLILWKLDRGLTLSQAMMAGAITGVVVFATELPTAGIADSLGRRPVLVVAALVNVASMLALLVADSFAAFVVAAALTGLFRALDSGPLEAWYVDTVHRSRPGADVDQDLSRMAGVMGAAMAGGSVAGSGLVAWAPLPDRSPLWLPVAVALALSVVHLVAVLTLLREPPRLDERGLAAARRSVLETPGVIGSGLALLRDNAVLRGLVLVELFAAISMITFENFMPVRLAELVGGEASAAVIMGPVAAGGWLVFAVGAAAAGRVSARIGVARTAILGRILTSLGAVTMGLAFGPIALVVTYFLTYSMHGFGGPAYNALLHREATSRNRATVLSLASMTMFISVAVASSLLGLVAEHTSTPVGMVIAGAAGLGGVICFLPALRSERARATDRARVDVIARA